MKHHVACVTAELRQSVDNTLSNTKVLIYLTQWQILTEFNILLTTLITTDVA